MERLFERADGLTPVLLSHPDSMRFRRWAALYHQRFPYQELAPLSGIEQSLRDHQAVILGLMTPDNDWAAFSMVEYLQQGTLLSYLATAKPFEGRGLAGELVRAQLATYLSRSHPYFWLEASPRLWPFYRHLGFRVLDFDFRIPEFHASGSEKMGLLIRPYAGVKQIEKAAVTAFVRELFLSSYGLKEADPRFVWQMQALARCPHNVFFL
jgi:GNAT superfamily N-acetyltransferase